MDFRDDIAAAVETFGVENIGLVWGLGMVPWNSPEERNAFLEAAKNKMG